MDYFLVYVTTSSEEEATDIGRTVVEGRLAACANVIEKSKSIYWWESEIQTATESLVILKTTNKNLGSLIDRVKQIHSYDCPCVVALKIHNGNEEFLNWIAKEI